MLDPIKVDTAKGSSPQAPQLLYSVPALARALSLSRSTLYKFFKSGALPFVKIGERRLIEASAVTDFIEQMKKTGASE